MLVFKISIVLISLSFQYCALGKGIDDVEMPWAEDELDHYINWLIKGYQVPGLSLAIVDDLKIAAKGYGYARLPSTPATPDTLWFTGSTTKAFTAAAAGILIEDEDRYPDLKWTSRIHDYLPAEFGVNDDYVTNHLTLEDAFSHRSGLPSHDRSYGWGNQSLGDIVKSMRYLPMTAEFRTVFQYCNLMIMVISRMLEQISGQSMVHLLRDLIWQPLGMRSTFFFPDEKDQYDRPEVKDRLARGYYWVDELHAGKNGSHYVPEPYMDLSQISGAGATVSSVNDYALWIKAMLQADSREYSAPERNFSSPITPEIYDVVLKRRIFAFGDDLGIVTSYDGFRDPAGYALGWMTLTYAGHPIFGHTGSLRGFRTNVWVIPDLRIGLAIMANTQDSQVVADLIIHAVFGARIRRGRPRLSQDYHQPRSVQAIAVQTSVRGCELISSTEDTTHVSSNAVLQEAASAFLGGYHHPAYGTVNVTLAQHTAYERYYSEIQSVQSVLTGRQVPDLHVQPSQRTWPFDLYLKHDAESWFQATRWVPHGMYTEDTVPGFDHGCDGSACQNTTVIVQLGSPTFVKFEYDPRPIGGGPRFQRAARIGIHLTDETRSAAEGYGKPGSWNQGAIWFDRVQ